MLTMPHTPLANQLAAISVATQSPISEAVATTQWRYLNVAHPPVTMGEGGTPLLTMHANLCLKDEGRNPNGSVQDRVASVLLTAARAAGCMHIALPNNNAAPDTLSDALAVSLAAYAAHAGLRANVTLSENASDTDYLRVQAAGTTSNAEESQPAEVIQPGELAQATRFAAHTIACEIAGQMRWKLPETVLLPSATPDEVLHYEKAFEWLRNQGRVTSPHQPRCIAVHMAPLAEEQSYAPARIAAQVLRQMSEAVAIVEADRVRASLQQWAGRGWMLSPGAAAALAFHEQRTSKPGTTVVVNPRSALACTAELTRLLRIHRYPGRMPVGGIITPQ